MSSNRRSQRWRSQDAELALILEAEFAAKSPASRPRSRARARTIGAARVAHACWRRSPVARLLRILAGGARGADRSPGQRLVLASLAFERARASERASDAVSHIERALDEGGWFAERQPDVVGPFYALVIGMPLPHGCARPRASIPGTRARAGTRAPRFPRSPFSRRIAAGFPARGRGRRAEADARAALDLLSAHDIRLESARLALLIEALIENGQLEAAGTALAEKRSRN